jgi:hypothetical protein
MPPSAPAVHETPAPIRGLTIGFVVLLVLAVLVVLVK